MANFRRILLIIILFSWGLSQAESRTSLSFYPFGAYTDETSVFLGGYTNYTWHPEGFPENYTPPSLELNLIASFKKQLRVLLRNKFVLRDKRFNVGIPLRYYLWPTTYYGIGNQEQAESEEKYTRQYYEFYPYIEMHVSREYLVSFSPYIEQNRIISSEEDNPLLGEDIKGFEDYFLVGMEFKIERNTTDKPYYPRTGSKLTARWKTYQHNLGSDYTYNFYTLDLRKYLPVDKHHTLAGQALIEAVSGDFPFEKYPDLGDKMRGFDDHVYIDKYMMLYRIEDRFFPFSEGFWQKVGLAVFAETGQTFSDMDGLNIENQKYSAGIGLRYTMVSGDMLNIRIDFAFSDDGMEMEIISFEAF